MTCSPHICRAFWPRAALCGSTVSPTAASPADPEGYLDQEDSKPGDK